MAKKRLQVMLWSMKSAMAIVYNHLLKVGKTRYRSVKTRMHSVTQIALLHRDILITALHS